MIPSHPMGPWHQPSGPMRSPLRTLLSRLRSSERGSMTVHGLFTLATCCAIGAAGLDTTHFFAARSQLQVAADLAAHAALVTRNQGTTTADQARDAAIAAVRYGMPRSQFGDVLTAADITFGTWDATSRTFTASATSSSAVRVVTGRTEADGNPVGAFLFRIVGTEHVDAVTQAIATIYQPRCLNEGFVAEGVVDVQSENAYYNGFCVHSNTHVELNQGNFFQAGTVVSMPNLSNLVVPNSGFTRNEGLSEALRTGWYDLRILDRIRPGASDSLFTSVVTLGTPDTPAYLTSSQPVPLPRSITRYPPEAFTPGRVHTRTCSGRERINLSGGNYANMVLSTNCAIDMSGKTRLENVVILTTSTASDSIKTPSGHTNGLELGRPDNCAAGWGAQIITRGGVSAAANLAVNGGQILALGDIAFRAKATGFGASFITAGRIDGTSNMEMSHCATGLEQNFDVPYYRIAG